MQPHPASDVYPWEEIPKEAAPETICFSLVHDEDDDDEFVEEEDDEEDDDEDVQPVVVVVVLDGSSSSRPPHPSITSSRC